MNAISAVYSTAVRVYEDYIKVKDEGLKYTMNDSYNLIICILVDKYHFMFWLFFLQH